MRNTDIIRSDYFMWHDRSTVVSCEKNVTWLDYNFNESTNCFQQDVDCDLVKPSWNGPPITLFIWSLNYCNQYTWRLFQSLRMPMPVDIEYPIWNEYQWFDNNNTVLQ